MLRFAFDEDRAATFDKAHRPDVKANPPGLNALTRIKFPQGTVLTRAQLEAARHGETGQPTRRRIRELPDARRAVKVGPVNHTRADLGLSYRQGMTRIRPAAVQEAREIVGRAWRIVQTNDFPEHVQPVALSEVVRLLVADRVAHPQAEPPPPSPLDPD